MVCFFSVPHYYQLSMGKNSKLDHEEYIILILRGTGEWGRKIDDEKEIAIFAKLGKKTKAEQNKPKLQN